MKHRTKKTKPKAKTSKQRKHRRPNPLRVRSLGIEEAILDSAGNLAVNAALFGCTYQEKCLASILIQLLLPIIKKTVAGMTPSDITDHLDDIQERTAEIVNAAMRRETSVRDETENTGESK